MNRVCEILGIKVPFIQAAMSWLTDAKLAAAVSNAGGLGILGTNAGQLEVTSDIQETAERTRNEIRKVRELTDKPFAVNIVAGSGNASSPFSDAVVDVCVEEKVPVVMCNCIGMEGSRGLREELVKKLKDAGIKIMVRPINPTVEEAKLVESQGADIFVATGFDEGGTLPPSIIGSFSIVPMLADELNIPIVLAGGVCDRRGVNAAFALGAEGVYCGTRMLASEECRVLPFAKEMIVNSKATDLDIFRCSPIAYYRALNTPLRKVLLKNDKEMTYAEVMPENGRIMQGTVGLRIAMVQGDLEKGYISTGTGLSVIKSVKPVKDIIDDMMADYVKGSFQFN